MLGPGKYDMLCSLVRNATNAEGAMVIVLEGNAGSGFSMQLPSQAHGRAVVKVLRDAANEIEKDLPDLPEEARAE